MMANKEKERGLLGVVADIIKVEKEYEIAIETALGGQYSKYCYRQRKYGKADDCLFKTKQVWACDVPAIDEYGERKHNPHAGGVKGARGFVGLAHTLVHIEKQFEVLAEQLLGPVRS